MNRAGSRLPASATPSPPNSAVCTTPGCGPSRSTPNSASAILGQPLAREVRLDELLRRPNVSYSQALELAGIAAVADAKVCEQVEVQAKYAGYIDRQQDEIERQRRHEETALPCDLNYDQVQGLSAEVRSKLADSRPATIGQAARIPGMTPAGVSLLLVHLRKDARQRA